MASVHQLISVFIEVRKLVARAGNNFDWSCWDDASAALVEIDSVLEKLCNFGLLPESKMNFLFLPTGPLQEVSISSGWGDEFCELADSFDLAMKTKECICFQSTLQREVPFSDVGMTDDYADITNGKCSKCGQVWLRYLYENEGFTGSGRWYLGAISELQANTIQVNQAKAILETLDWYWVGGSYYGGQIRVSHGYIP
ncbi:MAG: hypothetical protein WCI55_04685 [Armatimonadota bacterium]